MILDNLPAHEGLAIRQAVESTYTRLLLLPPYSNRLQPDRERVGFAALRVSKLKALLRKPAARTVKDLWRAIRDAIDAITPNECAKFFAAAGL